jgi:hypothetical protein
MSLTFKCQGLYPGIEHQFQVSVARGVTVCFPSVHVIFLASQLLLKKGYKKMEITGHEGCTKGGAYFSSCSHKTGCQLAVFIFFYLLRSMWLVRNLQQTLTLKMSPPAYRH